MPIDGLVIGGMQDYDLFREDLEGPAGVEGQVGGKKPAGVEGQVGVDRPAGVEGPAGLAFARVPGSMGAGFGGETPMVSAPGLFETYQPRRVLFLAPYRGMADDIERLTASGAEVRMAGPLPGNPHGRVHPPIVDMQFGDRGFASMLETSRESDFGEPVYLRVISSPGGGRWNKWWCVFRQCRMAGALLGAPLRSVHVASAGSAERLHVSVTLKTERDSTGHLLVASRGSGLRDDVFFLGTGGTLAGDALLNRPGVYDGSNYRLLPGPAMRRLDDLWHRDAVAGLSGAEHRFYHSLLRAIGKASRLGKGICLDYAGV